MFGSFWGGLSKPRPGKDCQTTRVRVWRCSLEMGAVVAGRWRWVRAMATTVRWGRAWDRVQDRDVVRLPAVARPKDRGAGRGRGKDRYRVLARARALVGW